MNSNFSAFVNEFKVNNPKNDFERSFINIAHEIKSIVSGIKEIIVSPSKQAPSENANFAIREFEDDNQADIEFQKFDFSEIKDILNSIEMNTSKDLVVRTQNQENRDNFLSSDENEAKQDRLEFDLEKKSFEIAKEQLQLVKEIRDTLKPRVPEELAEHKAAPIDLMGFLNNEQSSNNAPSLPDSLRRNRNNAVVLDNSKSDVKAKPQSKMSKLMSGAKFGMGGLALAGASFFAIDTAKQINDEIVQQKTSEIDDQVAAGLITPEQADTMKAEIISIHNKELNKTVSEEGGALSGGLAGAAMGAKIGSFLGPVGSIGGSIVGGLGGTIAGSEVGKKVGNYLNDNNIDLSKEIDNVKEKASGLIDTAKDKFVKAKEAIQTDLFPNVSKKVESFITTIKEGVNLDGIKNKANEGIESIKQMIEPESLSQVGKILGEQPSKFISNTIKETEKLIQAPVDDAKMLVNNIVNNQSNNNFIPLKATPRQESSGSALDRYTDKLSNF